MKEKKQEQLFDAIILGFGKGGKTLAGALAGAGKKIALVEQSSQMYGGTCINVGCIPTKFLVNRAKKAAAVDSFEAKAKEFYSSVVKKDQLISQLRSKNYDKLNNNPNVTVINGTGSFVSPHVIAVESEGEVQHLEGKQIFINTGSSSFIPPIPGIQDNPYVYSSDGILNLKELPKSLVIIGGGYIGMEFSSFFAEFGSQVTILQDGTEFLPREDAEIAAEVKKSLDNRGIQVLAGVSVVAIEKAADHAVIVIREQGQERRLDADAVLVATGRRPNTAKLNLEAAGVALDARGGIVTDDTLATSVPHIYAMGDVRGGLQFTYVSLDDFRIVRSAVLGDGSYTLSKRGAIPYSVFLNPAFSRVGLSEKEALEAGYKVKVAKLPAAAIPKAQVLEQPVGLLKAIVDEETGLVLGAHLFCEESYEMINIVKLAMDAKLPYTVLRDGIYTHPTMSEALNDLFAGI